MESPAPAQPVDGGLDPESRVWLDELHGVGAARDQAVERLYALLLRASRFEVARRRAALSHLRGGEFEDLAVQAADDALVSVLAKLGDFRGASRFTTWAYKFALLEAAVRVRRLAWQGREVPIEPERWPLVADPHGGPQAEAEQHELLRALQEGVEQVLTPHQRNVLVAVTINDVPIDVVAERLGSTRGAVYKTLHDARQKLRGHLTAAGFRVEGGSDAA